MRAPTSLLFLASGAALTVLAAAPRAAAQAVDYGSSFNDDEPAAPKKEKPDSGTSTDDLFKESGEAGDLGAQATGDSFPIFVAVTDTEKPDWTTLAPDAQVPPKKTKRLAVKGCELTIETVAYTVNLYRIAGIGEYELEKARLAPKTVLSEPAGGPLFVSVSADLTVTAAQKTAATCRKLFDDGRRHVIPQMELTTAPEALTGGKHVQSSKVVRPAHGDRLYVGWNKEAKTVELLNREGSAPTTESAVVKFEPDAGFYLTYAPGWKLVRPAKTTATASATKTPAPAAK